ncbi:MAG: UDP-N-acetylmuramoyl-tripeptide--D-alanyl-D-alanine ligase, partial [Lachnospiraceae bacterium]|nr:UDP-N-acetylmuramoyl-tripeptide--D-alanyl-D-alanine ligase [Lachnospiraceae bacterium]
AYYREQLSVKVVGITGSVGKTSTKEVIASVLSEKYNVLKTEGNFNNEIGLPLTVLKIREEHEVAVLEMGINHFGEMHRLSRVAKPDICVITNIGQCHLEFLIDRDGILRAKSEIFDYMNPEGFVCLNGDDDKLCTVEQVHGKRPIFFGKGDLCDVMALDIENLGLEGSKALVQESIGDKESYTVRLYVPGEHMVLNALAAISVGRVLGLSAKELISGIAKTGSVNGRSNIIKTDKVTIIDDCYNANPVSMKAAVELLETAVTKKIALLGDMFELGENEKQLHYEVGSFLAEKKIDTAICVGALSKEIYDAAKDSRVECIWFETKKELIENIHQLIGVGDTVLIKASHGMGFSELVEICSSHTWL